MGCCGTPVEDVEHKHGEPTKYDPTFNGPIKNRGCTDILCCLFFVVCVLGLAVTGYFAYVYGDPTILIYPTDSNGEICGYGSKASTPNLVFFDMLECARMGAAVFINGCPTPQQCVATCPQKYWVFTIAAAQEITGFSASARADMICKTGVDPTVGQYASMSITDLVTKDYCAPYYVNSTAFVGRCVPSIFNQITNMAAGLVTSGFALVDKSNSTVTGTALDTATGYLSTFLSAVTIAEAVFADCRSSWWMMLVGFGISTIVCLLYILLMRFIVGFMVWLTLFLFIALFGFSTGYCFYKYVDLLDDPNSNGSFTFTTNFSYYLGLRDTWLAFGIISAIFLLIILIILIFLRTRIRIAIAILKETSRAIGNMMSTLLWPLLPFILQVAVFAYWGATAIYLASSTKTDYKYANISSSNLFQSIPCDPTNYANDTASSICQFVKYGSNDYVIYLQLFNLFMLFWLANFVVAFGQMTLAGSFASYYWAFSKPHDIPAFPLAASCFRAFRYHLGSMAFGSLLVAIVQMIRAVLEYFDRKCRGSENPLAKFVLKCMKCCFWCLEKFIKFINKNAYIMIAVYGKNFCSSAKHSFSLIMRNIVRTVVVDKVSDFVLFVSKMVVVGLVGAAAYFFFDGRIPFLNNYTPSLNYYFVPVIVIVIGAYVIATCFFSVYSMGVDTLYLCFLEDLERNDGTPEKPYYMSKGLMDILSKKNKEPQPASSNGK
ncbi:choline transporter-like protein 2 isoform X2 [Lineus longissimus]|uniref:choline transporter-like protein 2 isoform X2 n=1 Tax=Lineus longissimus TaxID=88925 RepID=UPI002B4E8A28